ncbi:MAG: HipA domain-containing protein [Bdellovibrionia bacterium]
MSSIDHAKAMSTEVYRGEQKIGTIIRTKSGSIFEYDFNYLSTLTPDEKEEGKGAAFHLPYSRSKFETSGVNLHPYFAGLLPEGLRLKALVKKVKTSEDDLLSLLIASGSDCVGDLYVLPKGAPSPPTPVAIVDIGKVDQVIFADLFRQSVSPEGRLDEINIPGVQDKVSGSMISFPIRGKKDRSAYILKMTPPDKPKIVQNEYFFLKMAESCGLNVNQATIVHDVKGEEGLLIRRFDRVYDPKLDKVLSIHQEDACQFLNRYPADKYLVSMKEIAEGIQHFCSAPILDIAKLLHLKAFSYLIANGDLHAKNISIGNFNNSNRIEISPAYDLLSTLPYGDQKMALKLDGRDDNLKRKNFINFGNKFGIKEAAVVNILDQLVNASSSWIERLEEIGFDHKKTNHLRQVMLKRRRNLTE